MKKQYIFAIFIAVVIGITIWWVRQDYGLDDIRGWLASVENWRAARPILFVLLFFTIYVIVTAASLPFATVLTLFAGALFGFWQGLLIVSFASAIGATLAFLIARYLARDWAQNALGDRAKTINEGFEKDGPFFLFTLRLIPVVPFFAVNILMGLTGIRTLTYYVVSQLGMLPGTAVYVNAGTQLGQLDSLSGLLSPALLGSFVLLALFPWIARAILNFAKARKVYKNFDKPKSFDRNMVVIGAGAAGLVSSYIAAAVKAKVALVEFNQMGGDCLNSGCVPSKALIKSAKIAHEIQNADHFGIKAQKPKVPFDKVVDRIFDVIGKIEPHDSVERYTDLGVDVRLGYAKIVDPWRVEITDHNGDSEILTTRSIVIATGAKPFVPEINGIDTVGYLTSDTMWDAFRGRKTVPERLLVVGGGPIGSELTQSFARLGSNVTQVEKLDRLLGREDPEVSEAAQNAIEVSGATVLTGHDVVEFGVDNGQKWARLNTSEGDKRIEFDEVIIAIGRAARLTGYGLEDLGIDTNRTVETNEYLETVFPNILAAGDVAGPFQFTHTASHQAWFASVNALFGQFKKFKADYRVIPAVTFLDPEIARVGMNETEAKAAGIDYDVVTYGLDDLDRAIADGADSGFVKVLVRKGKDKILGATIVGANGGEILAEFVLAMKYKIGLNKILGTIHSYPTYGEANKFAAGNWKRMTANEKLLGLVEKYHDWRRG